MASYGVIKY